jgi:excisionase family DNA binding protein
MSDDDAFLTVEEVEKLLQVTGRTLYRLIKHDNLPGYRVGRQWRFRKPDVEAWLRANARRLSTRDGQAAQPAKRRVLIVDDQEPIRKFLVKALELANYEIETAEDGASALEQMRAAPFDLLVTDLQMPGMSGLALIREARKMAPKLAIVIITGHSTEAIAIEAINLGVGGYLTKPFRVHNILVKAARALGDPEPPAPAGEAGLSPET